MQETPTRLPVLCTIDQRPGQGGIALVARLLKEVMRRRFGGEFREVQLIPPGRERASRLDRARFIGQLVGGQLGGKFDWLFFDHIGLAAAESLVPTGYRRPYGVFLHSIEVWNDLSPSKLRALRGAAVRIANSCYTAERARAKHGDVGPVTVCPLALLPEPSSGEARDPDPVDADLLKRIQKNSVLIVGRIVSTERHKGHWQLIQAWPKVIERFPNAQLVVVGEGDDLDFFKAGASQLNCTPNVLFTGWVNDATLEAIYQRAAVFAMPSNGEGFGLVYLEAMKRRLPCIASSTDAGREIVVDGETGFLVDQTNEPLLVNRIVDLLEAPELRRQMGDAGFQRFRECFSFDQFAERVGKALTQLA